MSDKYTLYGLTTSPGGPNVSTFVNVTLSDMAILGVQSDLKPLTFPEIRGWLAKETGNNVVTVPTIKTPVGYVTDSWEVAQYLEKNQDRNPTNPSRSIFPYGAALAHLDPWVIQNLAPILRGLFRPLFYVLQDEPSREYFLRTKYGGNVSELQNDLRNYKDPSYVEKIAADCRQALGKFEVKLAETKGVFVLGDWPSHADSAVFGWYLSTRVSKAANSVWKNDENPRVKRWVKAMEERTSLARDRKVDAEAMLEKLDIEGIRRAKL